MYEKSGKITVAIAGNPNSGKTTMFNALTGSRQRVGNYPGVTVERREGMVKYNDSIVNFVDLPGIYSLSAYSAEELVSRKFLLNEKPHVVIVIIDATALDRSLYLVLQFLEMQMKVVIGLNMMDEVRRSGQKIDIDKLQKLLKVKIVPTVARIGEGRSELIEAAIAAAAEPANDFPEITYGCELDSAINDFAQQIQQADFLHCYNSPKMAAIRYLEQDKEIIKLGLHDNPVFHQQLQNQVAIVIKKIKKIYGEAPESLIADHRYGYIAAIMEEGVVKAGYRLQRVNLTEIVDKVLTSPVTGIIFLVGVLYAVFWFAITLGDLPMGWIQSFFEWLSLQVQSLMPDGLLQSLLVSGIIEGVGAVLGFVPLIALMFIVISFLEDTGYMARISYMLDRVFRIFGLHGNSIVALVVSGGIGAGCAVPGVMATRTLRSPKEKIATIITAPFMSCGAKMPVFTLLSAAFFPNHITEALFWITLASWGFVFIVAAFLRSTIIAGRSTPFLMELPPYRIPTLKCLLLHSWERVWQYIKKAGTVIMGASILLWVAMTYPHLSETEVEKFEVQKMQIESNRELSSESRNEMLLDVDHRMAEQVVLNSYAGRFGRALEPISMHAGFDWRINIALVGGFAAKEIIVSTLATAFSLGAVDPEDSAKLSDRLVASKSFTYITAISLILFSMLYAPCLVTVVVIAKEVGVRWAAFSVVFNTCFAFMIAVLFYKCAMFITSS